VTNSATASGAGQTSAPATTTITNSTITQTAAAQQTLTPSSPSNLTPGTTILHPVAVGEWLIQIGRCYGASFTDIRNANPQIIDPNFILPAMNITVPRIGSVGRIYGPPCITFYTAQSGDTWNSIAQRFNADIVVLQRVNPATFSVGTVLKIPLNSAGAVSVPVVTSTPTPTGTVGAPQRITFDPGQTTASRIGLVNPNETIHFVLSAAQGQVLSITLIANINEVAVGVRGPTGLTLKELNATQTWSATILNGGDHFIDIASILGSSSKSYTLNVSLVTPTTPTPTPTPTSTPTPTPTIPAPP
jgi:LysM repeat protein